MRNAYVFFYDFYGLSLINGKIGKIHVKKKETRPLPYTVHRIHLKWNKDKCKIHISNVFHWFEAINFSRKLSVQV